jgi:phosphate transport system substrate-binding protein
MWPHSEAAEISCQSLPFDRLLVFFDTFSKFALRRESLKTGKLAWLGVVAFLMALAGSEVGFCQQEQIVRVSGALPLTDLVSGWATDYMKSKPKVQVAVFGKTAGYGYSQFLDGQANLVMATREMTKEEQHSAAAKGIRVGRALVMNIPVVLITSATNPVSALTLNQLRDIYTGGISNWKDVGGPDVPIKVLMRPYPATGVAVLFKNAVLQDLEYRKDAVIMSSFKNMVHICEQSMAIGHIPHTAAFCNPAKYRIKIVAVKKDANSPGVLPHQSDYPIHMPFFFVWNADSAPKEVQDFVQYAISKAKEGKGPR